MALTRGHQSGSQQETAHSEQAISRRAYFSKELLSTKLGIGCGKGTEVVQEPEASIGGTAVTSSRPIGCKRREMLAEPRG